MPTTKVSTVLTALSKSWLPAPENQAATSAFPFSIGSLLESIYVIIAPLCPVCKGKGRSCRNRQDGNKLYFVIFHKNRQFAL